jgi:HEPN domain-containing protein
MRRPEHDGARWLAQARDDLEFARWLLTEDRFFDKGCFVAQQAAEKALKAILYAGGARTVLGHSVHELIGRVMERHPDLAHLRGDAKQLDRFYIPTRYPNGLPGGTPFESYSRTDLEQALAMTERIVSAAERILG